MPKNFNKQFSSKNVCGILLKNGLISDAQQEEIFKKKKLLSMRPGIHRSTRDIADSSMGGAAGFNTVDVITDLKIKREDDPLTVLDEDTIYQTLAKEWNIPFKKIGSLKLDFNLVTTIIPHTFAIKHLVLPLTVEEGYLLVGTPNPFNLEVMENISHVSHFKVRPVVCAKSELIKSINEFYGFKRSITAAEHQFSGTSVDSGDLEQSVRLKSAEKLPFNDHHNIINALNYIFTYAFDQRASDIHIEPKREKSLVRMRIDGKLHTVSSLPNNVHSVILSQIKKLARLDMAEKRKPQDGRIKTDKTGQQTEIRVSTIPTAFGEKVVMRIMGPDILFQDLEQLGFTSEDLIRCKDLINMLHGLVLLCGPTGSGKSTTLYSILRYLSTPGINITTIEDPIEIVHEDFNQIAVQPALDITFGSILRNILHQDPDIIMIGEMRDFETAENAVQAVFSGHLVLSTLHTNDAPSAVTRLLNLGVSPFFVQTALTGILGQRLIRKICGSCKESFEIDASKLKALGLDTGRQGRIKLFRGKGCHNCRGTGFLGRIAIYEVLPFTESIKKLITSEADHRALRVQARKEGMTTLRENAVKKLLQGQTTYQEVLRITWEQA